MILAIRTDNPQAELYLLSSTGEQLGSIKWNAGPKLSKDILLKIRQLLSRHKIRLEALRSVVVYRGPGSFTGLRVGVAVANTLGYSLNIPAVGTTGANWLKGGATKIKELKPGKIVLPAYGRPPNISNPRR